MTTIQGDGRAAGLRFALIVSKYNDFVTDRLQAGALAALSAAGAASSGVTVVRVPGAFEIPLAAQRAAESGRFDALVCLGCLIRGETPHFEFIASAVAHGTVSRLADADALIAETAERWRPERMAVIDRLILRLSVTELLRQQGPPPAVIINEALELARTFSTEEAVKFINGMLDAIR